MERIRGLEKIKSEEEYQKTRATLEHDVKEYVWLSKQKDPVDTVKQQLQETMKKLTPDMGEQEKEILSEVHRLETMYERLQAGTYLPDLKQNITANLVLVEQFDASKEKRSFWDTCKGILTGDQDTKDYLAKKYMITRVNRDGVIRQTNIRMQDRRTVIEYVIKRGHLVKISLDGEELDLVEYENNSRGMRTQGIVYDWTNQLIKERTNQEESLNLEPNPESKPKEEIVAPTQEPKRVKQTEKDRPSTDDKERE